MKIKDYEVEKQQALIRWNEAQRQHKRVCAWARKERDKLPEKEDCNLEQLGQHVKISKTLSIACKERERERKLWVRACDPTMEVSAILAIDQITDILKELSESNIQIGAAAKKQVENSLRFGDLNNPLNAEIARAARENEERKKQREAEDVLPDGLSSHIEENNNDENE